MLKYHLFWLKHALNDNNVVDAFPNYTSYDDIVKTSESGPAIPGGPNYYIRVGLLVNILLEIIPILLKLHLYKNFQMMHPNLY